jgi:hypothetical protein
VPRRFDRRENDQILLYTYLILKDKNVFLWSVSIISMVFFLPDLVNGPDGQQGCGWTTNGRGKSDAYNPVSRICSEKVKMPEERRATPIGRLENRHAVGQRVRVRPAHAEVE